MRGTEVWLAAHLGGHVGGQPQSSAAPCQNSVHSGGGPPSGPCIRQTPGDLRGQRASVMVGGAGDGNRTHTTSLEGWGSTIELRPHSVQDDGTRIGDPAKKRKWWAEKDSNLRRHSQQIYSLSPLTARESAHTLCLWTTLGPRAAKSRP